MPPLRLAPVNLFANHLLLWLLVALTPAFANDRARVIILADMGHDPDEEQQIVHLLSCANEFELEGLITVTGRFFRPNPTETVKDLRPHLFHEIIDAYAEVYPNLRQHAEGWPTPTYLHGIVARGQSGNGIPDTGDGRSSEGSRLILAAATHDDPRPLHIVINAGANTLAQALYDYRANHTAAEVDVLVGKLRVYENAGQDESGSWICHEFPAIHWIRSLEQTRAYGGPSNKELGPHTWQPFAYSPRGQHDWANAHVQTGHGALGARSPDRTVNGITHYLEGGGTVPWLGFVARGLSNPSEPSWGGWSGRYTTYKVENVPSLYSIIRPDEEKHQPYAFYTDYESISDKWTDPQTGETYNSPHAAVWRWRTAVWNDFQARMDWCVQSPVEANHHPIAAIQGDLTNATLHLTAQPGDTLTLDASASSDPDGDSLAYSWWHYREAGPAPSANPVHIASPQAPNTSIQIPAESVDTEIHLILEVWDQNEHVPLVDYRRVVIEVTS